MEMTVCRLPIVQGGGSLAFVAPALSILALPKFQCPNLDGVGNSTESTPLNYDDEIWKIRMREMQGAVMMTSLVQITVSLTGMIGFLLRFIGPLTIAPTITLMGISLFDVAAESAGTHWIISMTAVVLLVLFSQFLNKCEIPVPAYSKERGFYISRYPLFTSFSLILAILVMWMICAIVTAAGGFPDDPSNPQYKARTDARIEVLKEAKWFRVPYPGQWGTPTVSFAGTFGMLCGLLASLLESIGDYYACARMSGAPPPPRHAMNRGIGAEGVGCLLAGAFGCGIDTTSYAENIGAIGITKVGSLRVIQYAGLVMMTFGVLGKFGALFVTIPEPIIGGVFMVMFGMITSVGISNLQYADMNSSRNLFIVGFSLVFALAVPHYMGQHPNAIDTGVAEIDQVVHVLLTTTMAVGCLVALILDNTIPGTVEERGIKAWMYHPPEEDDDQEYRTASMDVYDLPFGLKRLSYFKFAKYLPILPYYEHHAQNYDVELNHHSV
ncbi:solute carrier family 23 member 2-like [Oculina patagonica]